MSEQGSPEFAKGGWIPSGLTRVQIEPGECIVRPAKDGMWHCVRADPVHIEAGHDTAAGVTEAGEYWPAVTRPPGG